MLTVFKFTSPVELKKNKQMDILHNLMSKMYDADLVEARIEAIAGVGEDGIDEIEDPTEEGDDEGPMSPRGGRLYRGSVIIKVEESWKDVLCGKFKSSTWMAAALCVF